MSGIKRKPLPDEINDALRGHASQLPDATGQGARHAPQPKGKAPPTVQVNFNASEDFARLIARLARDAGSTRRLFARWAKDAGHEVPEADLNPVDNRRRWAEP
jgi:hypothetical protein